MTVTDKERQAVNWTAEQIIKICNTTKDQGLKPRDFLSAATYTIGQIVGKSAPDYLLPDILTECVAGIVDGVNDARFARPKAPKDLKAIVAALVLSDSVEGVEKLLAALGIVVPKDTPPKHKNLRVVREDQH